MNTATCSNCGSARNSADGAPLCHACGFPLTQSALPKLQKRLAAAFALLHKSQFDKAKTAFEAIILKDSENASSYWGRLCARYHILYTENGNGKPVPSCPTRSGANLAEDVDYRKAMFFADEEMKAFLQSQAKQLKALCSDGGTSENGTRRFTMDEADPNDEQMRKQKKSKYALIFEMNEDGTYRVTGIETRNADTVVIPYTYQGKPVTEIGEGAFSNRVSLRNVLIPDSVKVIGKEAFHGCTGLTSITIPDSVKVIGREAFHGCTGLTGVTIPDGVKKIEPRTFEDCFSLTSIVIPNGVEFIAGAAFSGCFSLTSITIPDSVTGFAEEAFKGCSSLTGVTIPDGVKYIEAWTFDGCSSLTDITIPDSVISIGTAAFSDCSSLTSVTVPNSVTKISAHAFSGCDSLNSISLPFIGSKPYDVQNPHYETHLGHIFGTSYYFENNKYVPKSLKKVRITGDYPIGPGAFHCCESLKVIDIPGNVESMKETVFACCTGLKDIVIPKGVTKIEHSTFCSCNGLTNVVIPDGIKEIGYETFQDCVNLKSVTIPDSVTHFGNAMFKGCTRLMNVHISGSCLSNTVIPADIKKNTPEALIRRGNLTGIPSSMFENCVNLINFIIPYGVTEIGLYAFRGCSNLTHIVIPSTVKKISTYAFEGCKNLTSITYVGTKAQWKAISLDSAWDYMTGNYTVTFTGNPGSK